MLSNEQAEIQFKLLRNILQDHLTRIEEFTCNAKTNKDTRDVIYNFQALMDGLIPLMERADQITATIDHG